MSLRIRYNKQLFKKIWSFSGASEPGPWRPQGLIIYKWHQHKTQNTKNCLDVLKKNGKSKLWLRFSSSHSYRHVHSRYISAGCSQTSQYYWEKSVSNFMRTPNWHTFFLLFWGSLGISKEWQIVLCWDFDLNNWEVLDFDNLPELHYVA